MAIRNVYDGTFDKEALRSARPVLIEFWAPGVVECRQLGPILQAFDAEHGDQVAVLRVNVEYEFDVPTRYAVRALPTLVLLVNGHERARWTGVQTRETLEHDIAAFVREPGLAG